MVLMGLLSGSLNVESYFQKMGLNAIEAAATKVDD